MAGDLVNLLGNAATVGGVLGYLNILPPAAKDRLISSCNFIIGRYKRRVDVHDKREDAEIADEEKRAGNKTTAEQKVLETLVPDIAKRIAGDEALMGRALVSVMGEAYRKQENKEAVVEECLKDIAGKEENVSSNPDPLDEDWLDIFSSYAEKANTERTRQLWGRILSGEVRKPGMFSLKTLRLLSEIDKDTANLFVEKAKLVSNKAFIIINSSDKNKNFHEYLQLQDSGILLGVDVGINITMRTNDKGILMIDLGDFLIELKSNPNIPISLPAIGLTKASRELLNIISYQSDINQKIQYVENAVRNENLIEEYRILEKPHSKIKDENLFMSKVLRQWKRGK